MEMKAESRSIKPHYSVSKEVLTLMNPVARLTAELCIAHGTWELKEENSKN